MTSGFSTGKRAHHLWHRTIVLLVLHQLKLKVRTAYNTKSLLNLCLSNDELCIACFPCFPSYSFVFVGRSYQELRTKVRDRFCTYSIKCHTKSFSAGVITLDNALKMATNVYLCDFFFYLRAVMWRGYGDTATAQI